MNVVSESGLYALVFTSRKPEAKAFHRRVTGEVLPSIRKTGQYQLGQGAPGQSGAETGPKFIAPSVVLPGPGRYIAVVMPDGTISVRATEYDAMLGEVTAAEARTMCHSLKVIEGHWNGAQQLRALDMDPHDAFVYRALEGSILSGGALADHHLRFRDIVER